MPAAASVQIAVKDKDGNIVTGQTIPLDASGNIPVSLSNQPLPAGAATSAGVTALGADGGLATVGLKADAAPANPTAAGTLVGLLKGIWAALQARLPLDTNGNLKQVLYDSTGAAVSYGGTTSTTRPPLTYSTVTGSPFTLTSAWSKVVTTTATTKGLRISPLAAASTYDIEWIAVAAGAAAPTDAYGEPIQGGEDFAAGLPIGDVYLKSASGQVAIVRTGA